MPEYSFNTLSPSDFELLVRDLLYAEYGWQLEAFGHGRDGGVDLRGYVDNQKVIVQCKHYSGSSFSQLRSSAKNEVPKISKERPDRYLFATSLDLSRTQKDALIEDLKPWIKSPGDLLTARDLNALLQRHPTVERQHFKLWLASANVLQAIVQSGLWERSEALMEDIRDRVRLYVRSPAYDRAASILAKHHVVVITGPPGVGKSMLAEMLCLTHWHNGWQVISVSSDINEAWDAYRRDQKQIFFYDDFLGQTDISERGTKNEDSRIVRFMDRVAAEPTKRLVMTTRSQILRQASLTREPIARGNFKLRECVIPLTEYGALERAQILYNHLYFSNLSRDILRDYVAGGHYWKVVNHPNFAPRIIEQVIKRPHSSAEELSNTLVATLTRPTDLWGTMFATALSDVARRIVLTLSTFPPTGVEVGYFRNAIRREADPISVTHALRALEGTFIKIGTPPHGEEQYISYANPSVRDFVLATLDEEPEYCQDLISNAWMMGQLLALLEYASSKEDGKLKLPRLASYLRANGQLLLDNIRRLIRQELNKAFSGDLKWWQVESRTLVPLARMLEPVSIVAPNFLDKTLQEALDLHDLLRDKLDALGGSASALAALTRGTIRVFNHKLDSVTPLLSTLITEWGNSLLGLDEIEEFVDFFEKTAPALPSSINATSMMRRAIEQALLHEIDTIGYNRTDRKSDESWLDAVEELAHRAGIQNMLQDAIERERNELIEYYDVKLDISEPEEWYVKPYTPPARDDKDMNTQIRNLFTQLT
ncbi:restriction endonuclease [Thermobispora bispora]|uniref:nSTAND3 domain-containing NTPase n=1 Tax=Thermobispora bispora TaxID=2006 RepID=UPI00197FC588|nr:hypothetical protein CYL17_02075 [Thermobispora bispora]